MILICSSSEEYSIFKICSWLKKLSIDYIVLDETSNIICKSFNINTESFVLEINGIEIKSEKITGVWYRKSSINLSFQNTTYTKTSNNLNDIINHYTKIEIDVLSNFINTFLLTNKKTLGSPSNLYINKLTQLYIAKKVGLKIPDSNIISHYTDLDKNSIENEFITKSIFDTFLFKDNDYMGSSITKKLKYKDIKKYKNVFQPSLFQRYIDKQFEIRSFLLNNTFYSMAIFSQDNPKTSVDFRNYDDINPNRMVPYCLPKYIENKLLKFCNLLKIDTGSFDILYSRDHEFYFLEVNPIGQFDFVSGLCNYKLDKKIAEHFIQK
jgi:ATP-GRASP peptide maturase of grasp-with-spasm system